MRPLAIVRSALLLYFLLTTLCIPDFAQTAESTANQSAGSISGKVTLSGKPAVGTKPILVINEPASSSWPSADRVVARIQTGDAGAYSFTNLAPGHYRVLPADPTAVLQNDANGLGKVVLLDGGEHATSVDVALEQGGVITGRVVDASNQPVIGEQVFFENLDDRFSRAMFMQDVATDDRGIYRAYGVRAGRYRVSVGGEGVEPSDTRHFPRTYSPGVTDAAEASIVEVKLGAESANVDITLGAATRTYAASGAFIDEGSGQPVPNVSFYCSRMQGDALVSTTSGIADPTGRFALQGLAPGHYKIVIGDGDATGYAVDSGEFEIQDSNVEGVVVKLTGGASVSGTITIDNNTDPALASRISGIPLEAQQELDGGPNFLRRLNQAPDGSFQLTGLSPGYLVLEMDGTSSDSAGFRISRVELNGVNQGDGIQITAGQNIVGVNIVVAYGAGIVRGSINMAGEALPQGARLYVSLRKADAEQGTDSPSTAADSVGRFQINSVPDGDYQVLLQGLVEHGLSFRRLNIKYSQPTVSVLGGQSGDVVINAQLEPAPPKQ